MRFKQCTILLLLRSIIIIASALRTARLYCIAACMIILCECPAHCGCVMSARVTFGASPYIVSTDRICRLPLPTVILYDQRLLTLET